jgi:TonB family protein
VFHVTYLSGVIFAAAVGLVVAGPTRAHAGGNQGDVDTELQVVGEGPEAVYLRAVHNRVHRRWADSFLRMAADQLPRNHPVNVPTRRVVLDVTLAPDGAVLAQAIAHGGGSGSSDFDKAALDVVAASTPFPAAPAEALSDDGRVHLRWAFARDGRRCGDLFALQMEGPLDAALPRLFAEGRDAEALRRVRVAAAAAYSPDEAVAVLARTWLARTGRRPLAGLPVNVVGADSAIADKVREMDRLATGRSAARRKLVALSKRGPAPVRVAALIARGRAGDKRAALAGLTPLLYDRSLEVRIAAAAGLAGIVGEAAVPVLAAALSPETDPALFEAVAARLARGSGKASAELLGRILLSRQQRVRLAAAAALAARFDAPARKLLGPLASDPDPRLRFYAATVVPPADWRELATAVGSGERAAYRALLGGPAPGRSVAGIWLLTHFDDWSPATQGDVLGEYLTAMDRSSTVTAAR